MPLKRVVFLVGPTAVGKTRIAVELAAKINAEIISCDSMQIYKGMGIITSKPQAFLRRKIKHHLIGMVLPEEEYNVSKYRQEALKKIKEIIRKGKTPLFCGGTGLYVSILIDGIFKARAQNPALRKKLYRQFKKYGRDYLYKKLKRLDHKAAENIHPNDIKRTIRALEVFETTGKPISRLQQEREGLNKNYDIKIFCLNMERSVLYKRIDIRVDKMFRAGLLKETRRLLKKKLGKTSRYAIGLNESAGYFEGKYDLAEAKRLIKRNTRHYAKRQLTWFRKDKRIQWLNILDKDTPAKVAKRLWKELY
ncbi:MAG: tRNA (adenosine(37)-N6)-dimethylallyltransferase MiaA [Candidatus Omnitrophica bacterium]|nr:tRNA (adenosine(37)-N6)-dimethylallyltransferase MiaA [Candidatus Omnitrophota bacterium]MDD5662504.1 tRNA (adenosine(37)-N6)-dimethylallyltransferase MiaA [Candidatus Omnitrophota bacterium]